MPEYRLIEASDGEAWIMDQVVTGYGYEVSDQELLDLERQCESEIVERIDRGDWQDFWDECAGSLDLHMDVQTAFKEMSGSFGKPDAAVAMGGLKLVIDRAAREYARNYVDACDDVQELAFRLRIMEA